MIRNTEDFINEVENKWPNKFDFSKQIISIQEPN